jgi:SAM-dependent methyltransferase
MFSKTARYYDKIYAAVEKDYAGEAEKLHNLIQTHQRSQGKSLLDVACGTGLHTDLLSKYYQVEGLDIDRQMLAVASEQHPGVRFHQGDMVDFDLGRRFDVIVCLFSSIGYVKTKPRLRKALKNLADHLAPGGVLLVEPWFTPGQWHPGRASMTQVNEPDLKIVRMSYGRQRGRLSFIDFEYLVGTPQGIEHYVEVHELGLFTHQEYMDTFKTTGLSISHDPEGLDGRGLYIGAKLPA